MPSTLYTEAIIKATMVSEVEAIKARKIPSRDRNLFAICFNCKKPGHIAKNFCFFKTLANGNNYKKMNKVFNGCRYSKSKKTTNYNAFSSTNNSPRTSEHVQCYACQTFGHYTWECNSKRARPYAKQAGKRPSKFTRNQYQADKLSHVKDQMDFIPKNHKHVKTSTLQFQVSDVLCGHIGMSQISYWLIL